MEHEVFIPVPAETLREALRDHERVARCVPGLQQDADASARPLSGRLKVRVGGHTITYRGALALTERAGVFTAKGEGAEVRGAGSAKLNVRIRLTEAPGGTTVAFTATVTSQGRLSDIPTPTTESTARRLLDRFVTGLAEPDRDGAAGREGAGPVGDGASDAGQDVAGPGAPTGVAPAVTDGTSGAAPDAAGRDRGPGDESDSASGGPDQDVQDVTGSGAAGRNGKAAGPEAAGPAASAAGGAAASDSEVTGPVAPGAGGGDAPAASDASGEAGSTPRVPGSADAAGAARAARGAGSGSESAGSDASDVPETPDSADAAGSAPDGPGAPHGPDVPADADSADAGPDDPAPDLDASAGFGATASGDGDFLVPLDPPAEAAHARRTMIGRSAEEVDHAPPRGRYAPAQAPDAAGARAALRWVAPAAALAVAGAVVVGRALRRRR